MGGMRMLLVEGLGNVGRRQVFSQFKRYGYMLGMEVGWGMAWIQYDCAEAVDKAIRATVNDAMECRLIDRMVRPVWVECSDARQWKLIRGPNTIRPIVKSNFLDIYSHPHRTIRAILPDSAIK
jgi:hypothetical protein